MALQCWYSLIPSHKGIKQAKALLNEQKPLSHESLDERVQIAAQSHQDVQTGGLLGLKTLA